MKTKDIIEGLLYITNHRSITVDCLKACHILGDGRSWEPIQHSELYFIDKFKTPSYLMIIDKQVHVYILGDKIKNKIHNILNVEGFSCELLAMNPSELLKHIKTESKEVDKYYLPMKFNQRIIYLQPDYNSNTCKSYIFNRQSFDGNMFKKSAWTLGNDIYSVTVPEHDIKAEDIIKEILQEL